MQSVPEDTNRGFPFFSRQTKEALVGWFVSVSLRLPGRISQIAGDSDSTSESDGQDTRAMASRLGARRI